MVEVGKGRVHRRVGVERAAKLKRGLHGRGSGRGVACMQESKNQGTELNGRRCNFCRGRRIGFQVLEGPSTVPGLHVEMNLPRARFWLS